MEEVKGSRREQAAHQTRRQVLAVAAELFVTRGYVATTIDQVAAAAGVSRPTVFAIGNKAQLFALARDVAMAGDDDAAPVSQRESAQRVLGARDPHDLLALLAEHVTAVQERYGPLDEALHRGAGADPELAALWRTAESQRRQGAALFVGALAALAQPADDAVDTLWLLMAPDVHTRLVRIGGWSRRRYVAWLTRSLRALLLPPQG